MKGPHAKGLPWKVYTDKGYGSEADHKFLSRNGIGHGIMSKDQINAKLTETEIRRNRRIAEVGYKIEQCFGLRLRMLACMLSCISPSKRQ